LKALYRWLSQLGKIALQGMKDLHRDGTMENSAGPAEMGTDVAGMELKLVQKPNIAYLMGES